MHTRTLYLFAGSAYTGLLGASYFLHSVLAFFALFPRGLLFLKETMLQNTNEHAFPVTKANLLKLSH